MTPKFEISESLQYSEWRCELIKGVYLSVEKDKEPNWFWRKMQYLMFGFKWSKK